MKNHELADYITVHITCIVMDVYNKILVYPGDVCCIKYWYKIKNMMSYVHSNFIPLKTIIIIILLLQKAIAHLVHLIKADDP